MTTRLSLFVLLLAGLAACTEHHADGETGAEQDGDGGTSHGSSHDDDHPTGDDREGMEPPSGPACVASGVTAEISVADVDKLDLLFVVDNSGSMAEEQASLRDQFPRLISTLSTGTRPDGSTFPHVADLHLGVVSSDMGLIGIQGIDGCEGLGDDGIMLNTPSQEITGCQASYPRFLTYTGGVNDPQQTATDFACIASLGTAGCSFEQPLEAGLKALWPSIDIDPETGQAFEPNRIFFLSDANGFGQLGHGDTENAGFLRNDPVQGLSVIAIVVVTDEEDCSSKDTHHFTPPSFLPVGDELAMQDMNLRCFFNPQDLYPLERYINGYQALRPGNENMVFFAAIAGVPPDLVEPEDFAATDWGDDAQRDGFYDRILSDPRMQQAVDPATTPGSGAGNLVPSCNTERGKAYPPIRMAQVAKGFGRNGSIYSICQADLGPAVDGIVSSISGQLGATCLPRPLVRNSQGLVEGCDVLWELPPPGMAPAATPTACQQHGFEFLLPPDEGRERLTDRGGSVCKVAQLQVQSTSAGLQVVPAEVDGATYIEGWYYDDFSEEVRQGCAGASQRIAFTDQARPPVGVTVQLDCLNQTFVVDDENPAADTNVQQPALGDPCEQVIRNGVTLMGDAACAVRLANGDTDTSMFCHPERNTCERSCDTDSDCPSGWACDASESAQARSGGRAFCAPPSCSAGPQSGSSSGVGAPCLPDTVPEGGFDDNQAYLSASNADCGGGVCLAFRLLGDPRENCVPTMGNPETGEGGVVCATPQDVAERVYCSCRCDAPEGYAECGCPDGFSCVDVLDQGSADIRGGYCVRNGTSSR